MKKCLLLAFLVVSVGAGRASALDWQRRAFPEDGFAVEFPPGNFQTTSPSTSTMMYLDRFVVGVRQHSLAVQSKHGAPITEPLDKYWSDFVARLKSSEGKVTTAERTTFKGFPALRTAVTFPNGNVRDGMNVLMPKEGSLYILSSMAGKSDPDVRDHFWNSFEYLPARK
ncbi:MAG: hypothetical protein JO102_05175 [Elusimicrobia bacterium]|nr:hypothetical protein [Elusimicrobiota bacterium]